MKTKDFILILRIPDFQEGRNYPEAAEFLHNTAHDADVWKDSSWGNPHIFYKECEEFEVACIIEETT